jgi:hypothetical protein
MNILNIIIFDKQEILVYDTKFNLKYTYNDCNFLSMYHNQETSKSYN